MIVISTKITSPGSGMSLSRVTCRSLSLYSARSPRSGSFATKRIVRCEQSRTKVLARWSKVTSLTRSSKARPKRETNDTSRIAAMNTAAILTPSGRSTTFAPVV